jgi:hypothetical protein
MVHQNAHGLIKLAILIWLANLFVMPIKVPTYLPKYITPKCVIVHFGFH